MYDINPATMSQVPHIAMFCQELPSSGSGSAGDTVLNSLEDLHFWNLRLFRHFLQVPVYLLPLVVRFLTDTNNQVGFV